MMNNVTSPPRKPKLPRGTTLLEGVIAIGVILVGVVGALVLINTTINLGRQNQDRIVAQNLAREGLELAYSLRSSASLFHSQNASTTWDAYLFAKTRPNLVEYNNKYNIGVWSDNTSGGDGQCYQRCNTSTNIPGCLSENGGLSVDGITSIPGSSYNDSAGDEQDIACDTEALSGYLYGGFTRLPPFCATSSATDFLLVVSRPYWNGSNDAKMGCNYDGSGDGNVDIADLSAFIYNVYLLSNHYVEAYPAIFPQQSGVTDLNATLKFYIEPNNAAVNLDTVWQDSSARVSLYNGAYIQNPPTGFSGAATPTKYYRVVTLQEVCRNDATGTETVVDQTSAESCENMVGYGQKVGVLVTSEVRWPKSTSSTSVRYQEYLYNWLTP